MGPLVPLFPVGHLVSPYGQLNAFVEAELPQALPGWTLDVVDRATTAEPPYLDAAEREQGRNRPGAVLDFGYLLIEAPFRQKNPQRLEQCRQEALQREMKGIRQAVDERLSTYTDGPAPKDAWTTLEQEVKDLYDVGDGGKPSYLFALAYLERTFRDLYEKAKAAFPLAWRGAEQDALETVQFLRFLSFTGYRTWAREEGVPLLHPSRTFARALRRQWSLDCGGDAKAAAVSVRRYEERLRADLTKLDSADELDLFARR
ncbi:MAG: hypothetical protein HY520_04520 [Candidatus Aenigmarchaeota archaeon]|nr:hypothetical protein [Candidatus Aenigmarchaeota archaeon]